MKSATHAKACRFLHQILAGVERVHETNVVHRDMKPENLLLDERQCIKIVDFGLSNTFQDQQLLQTACGSPCYAAPEMIAGNQYYPPMVDVWSCGVILFALVCGFLPFEDQNHAELYKKILNAEYEVPNFISKEVAGLIGGMLTTDPDKRMTLAAIRKHVWYQQIPEASLKDREDDTPNEAILQQLDSYGFPREYAIKCLQSNKHNHVTTTYYLIKEKQLRSEDLGMATRRAIAEIDATCFEESSTRLIWGNQKLWPLWQLRPEARVLLRIRQGLPPLPLLLLVAQIALLLEVVRARVQKWAAHKPLVEGLGASCDRLQALLVGGGHGNAGYYNHWNNQPYNRRAGGPARNSYRRPAYDHAFYDRSDNYGYWGTGYFDGNYGSYGGSYSATTSGGSQEENSPPWSTKKGGRRRKRRSGHASYGMPPAAWRLGGVPKVPSSDDVSCNTSQPPRRVMEEVTRALKSHGISWRKMDEYVVRCQNHKVRFQAEILEAEQGQFLLRFRKASGDAHSYNDLCARLLTAMKL
eukprot:g22634.t1